MIKINSADISSSLPTIRKELTVTPILYGDYNKWSEMNSTFKVYFEYGPVCYLPWFYAHKKDQKINQNLRAIPIQKHFQHR